MLCDQKEGIDLYDYIELKDGRKGHVIEKWDEGKCFDIELDEQYATKNDDRIEVVTYFMIKRLICKA